ncbi:MAG: beta-N-acetylglucosaminidase domain-containing protein, partial [Deltaproteobacteria bacterium]|nr:beta-N-acetylglucosaminidase domain-containing protein [Deltaproteobacteria bacterium]
MSGQTRCQRRGIVEGFFGPPWSMAHRAAIFEFGARRGMNTYLYAPKDDPYHRERWKEPYP